MEYLYQLFIVMLDGLKYTFLIFFITLFLSLPLGIIVSLGRLSNNSYIRIFFQLYIYTIRGTPLLLQLIFVYYGLPSLGIVFNRLTAVYITFAINYSAYFGEIFRGGIQSIDKGQYEAAKVLGITKIKTFLYIILPQVIKRVLTAVSNEVVTLVKDTSLVYVLGITELLRTARIAANRDASLYPYLLAGLIYLGVLFIITKILENLESRYAYY